MLKRLRVLFVAVVVLAALLAAAAPALAVQRPTKVMIVVMDQMQPGYAKQFNMSNVLWLQNKGVTFPNAWVGDMASETVVSHNVMVSGLFPKHMGWSDEAIRDVHNILGYGTDAIVTTGDLGYADYVKLIENMDYPKLGDYLHEKFPGTVVANVGQKGYQVESMAASSSDYWVRMGSKKNTKDLADPSVVPWTGKYRGPSGNLPDYIKSDTRFLISSGNAGDTYETTLTAPSWMYPEDGRYVPGPVADHTSGDNWVADAALKIMDNEDWSGLWVTFSAIDKIGHLWGGGAVDTLANYKWDPNTILNEVHMPWAAKNADDQLGKLIAKLKEKGQFNDTLIVVCADHGSTYGRGDGFKGANELNGGDVNWYAGSWLPGYGTDPKVPNTSAGSPALKPLMDTGKVEFSYQSTAIETWLKADTSSGEMRDVAAVMETLPGVIATYIRNGDRYKLYSYSTTMTPDEKMWWTATGQQIVNTMCFSGSADIVGLLADKTTYGVFGDHGGAQADVQRIPMAFYMPGVKHLVSGQPMRLVDIMPTILKTMGIPAKTLTDPMDGSAFSIKLPK
ncbi:MAG: alkaline phosphatase family protein [Actinobacteria bacterium]|nr:alkaline phosphatase family protein [Actinomycetota bacterium]